MRTLLSDSYINELRNVRDAVRIQGVVVADMPVTEVLIKSVQLSHTEYKKKKNKR